MKISRQVGTVSEILNIFVPDATVTTGAGLANVIASSVQAYWLRNDATGISSTAMTSSALVGTFSSGGWVQVNSNSTLGWYQFGIPNAALASGRSTLLHFSAAPSMAPIPVEIELTKTDNQTYVSSQGHNVELFYKVAAVTTAAGIPSTDSRSILGTTYLTSVAGIQTVNVSTVIGSAVATSAAGRLTVSGTVNITSNPLLGVSSVYGSAFVTSAAGTLGVDVLTILNSVPITSAAGQLGVNVQQLMGTAPVTSAAGIQTINVRDIYGTAFVTTAAGVPTAGLDLQYISNPTSTVALSGTTISTVVSSVIVAGVNVTSVAGTAVVTSAAGVVATYLDWGRTLNENSTVAFSSVSFSSVSVSVGGVNVTSIAGSAPVTSAAGTLSVNQLTILGSTPVTSAAGRYTVSGTTSISSVPLVGVSTLSVPVGISSVAGSAIVTSAAGIVSVNVTTIHGSAALTSAAGRYLVSGTVNITSNPLLGVSTLSVPVGVSSIAVLAGVSTLSVPVGVSSISVLAGVSTITVPVGVTTFALPVGVSSFAVGVGVSSFDISVGVSSVTDKTGYRLDATGSAALTEGYAALGATGTLPQILYEIRALLAEKTIVGTSMTTKQLDGSTTAEVFTFDNSTAPLSVTRTA